MNVLKNIIYTIIDFMTFNKGIRRKINEYNILFPAKWARYFEKNYEKENIEFLSVHCKKNDVVIDIGAHIGLMSVICAKLVGAQGKVYSFEPTPKTYSILQKIIKLNHVESIVLPLNKAVSDQKGSLPFYIDDYEGSNANSLVINNHRERHAISIDLTSVDIFYQEFNIEKIDILKIDAEGTELDVLKGAIQVIKKFHPKIILAIHPQLIKNNNQTIAEIYDLIYSLNYHVIFKKRKLSKEEFCQIPDFFDVHLFPAQN